MNIAMKNAKQKKRRTPQQMLLAGVMLFFFTPLSVKMQCRTARRPSGIARIKNKISA